MSIRKIHIEGTPRTTQADVLRFIDNCYDVELLRQFSKRCYDKINGEIARNKIRAVKVNDYVRFNHKKTGTVEGIVLAVMRTKVKVRVHDHTSGLDQTWRVPATLLEFVGPDHAAIKREVNEGWER